MLPIRHSSDPAGIFFVSAIVEDAAVAFLPPNRESFDRPPKPLALANTPSPGPLRVPRIASRLALPSSVYVVVVEPPPNVDLYGLRRSSHLMQQLGEKEVSDSPKQAPTSSPRPALLLVVERGGTADNNCS